MASTDTPQTDDEQATNDTLRRRIVQTFGGLGIASFAGAMLTPLKTLGIAAQSGETEVKGQNLVLAKQFESSSGETFDVGATITKDMMSPPDSILAYPAKLVDRKRFRIRLHRLEPDQITEPTKVELTAEGYVAYSAICTHLGCTVDWIEEAHQETNKPYDHCYCHGSEYDPYEGAKVIHPPASRPLPQIGVTISDEGNVQLTSDFEAKVGP
ncbi:MAG: ubiquinol-cytochrome c reductase iron-sulfur subunit [Halanaeroarchaeum sp.]